MSTQSQDSRHGTGHGTGAATREAAQECRQPPAPGGPSIATVVWGLVLLSLAALAGLTELTGWDVDPTLALPAVLLGAGALLVVTAVIAVVRRPRRGTPAHDGTDQDDRDGDATPA
jgi:hypothetical protein